MSCFNRLIITAVKGRQTSSIVAVEHFHVLLWRWNLVVCSSILPLLKSNMVIILCRLLLVRHLVTKSHTYCPQPSSPCVDTEPPVIDRCRSPPIVQATDAETAVVWEVPQFSDNSGMSGSCSPGVLFCRCSVFFTVLHLRPAPLMNKRDLFRLEKEGEVQGEGVDQCCPFVCLCV